MYRNVSSWEEKKEKTIPEKLKNFFGLGIAKSGGSSRELQWKPKAVEIALSKDILKELGPDNTLVVRLKAMRDLYDTVLNKHLEDNTLEVLVTNTEDLVSPLQSLEARHTVLKFYRCLIQGQFEKLADIRAYFFRLLKDHTVMEDLSARLDLFKALSDCGKNIEYFEEETGPFLLDWMPAIISSGKTHDFLKILVNFIKCNAAYLDSNVIAGLIQHTCVLLGRTKSEEDIKLCLDMLDAFICYSSLPSEVLPHFIISLCRIVNIKKFSQKSWQVTRHYLGTSMGQSGIFTICWLMQDRNHLMDFAFLRGAVFYLRLALWGEKKVASLSPLLTAVLPSLLQSLSSQDNFVAFEVVTCIQSLMESSDRTRLQQETWDLLLKIIDRLMAFPGVQSGSGGRLSECIQNSLTQVEDLYAEKLFLGSAEQLFQIIDRYSSVRPESSVVRLIDYKSEFIHPKHENWINKLNHLLESFFKCDTRSSIRVKTLMVLSKVVEDYRHLYEKELIDQSVLKFFSHIDIDPDLQVRNVTVKFLVNLTVHCVTSRCVDLIEIIGKVLCRQFVTSHNSLMRESIDMIQIFSEEELNDVKIATEGLIELFNVRLFHGPPNHGLHAYNLLISYLQSHYSCSQEYEQTSVIRRMILKFLLSLRASSSGQIYLAETHKTLKCSYSMYCTSIPKSFYSSSPPLLSPTASSGSLSSMVTINCDLNFKTAFEVIITCLKEEKDWCIFSLVLQELPNLLCNKALVMCGGSCLSSLCTQLCTLVQSKAVESFQRIPPKFTKTDFHSHIFPILTKLAAYHMEIGSRVQRLLINCLHQGLFSKCVKACIMALTICTLQMQDTMYKLLPDVLLGLSKISATLAIANPILEFLSNLIRHPRLYKSFVEDQFMSIFAIALPYTNPFKFQQYTVALAHHVIAMWFIKCRQPFRKDFVRYIMKGLRANVVAPFEEPLIYPQAQSAIEGVQRQRSGSLHDPTQKRMEWPQRCPSLTPNMSSSDIRPRNTRTLLRNLHEELLETCLDLFGRYCFMTLPNLPKRDDLTEFLMERGLSQSWLVGNSLITITTSGPGNMAYKEGLCKECYMACFPDHVPEPDIFAYPRQPAMERKRHKSAINPSSKERSYHTLLLTKDDLLLHRSSKNDETQLLGKHLGELKPTEATNNSENNTKKTGYPNICSCWCPGWAEILIRRPTGNYYSLMRVQHSMADLPLPDLRNWFDPEPKTSKQNFRPPVAIVGEKRLLDEPFETLVVDGGRSAALPIPNSKSPLRRTSSSPDMQSSWLCHNPTPLTLSSPPLSPSYTKKSLELQLDHVQSSTSRSSPSSPVSKQSPARQSSFEDQIRSNENKVESINRSSVRGSPRKEEGCNTILEEDPSARSSSVKRKLKLDLTGVNNPSPSSKDHRTYSPPLPLTQSADMTKSRPNSTSPFTKRIGSNSPPPLSSSKPGTHAHRDRLHTISGASPVSPRRSPIRSASFACRSAESPLRDPHRLGLHPSYVLLQLSQTAFPLGSEPLLLPKTDKVERAVKVLDHIQPYETHKIGVVYVGPGQATNEAAILSNCHGSLRYQEFLFGLGTFIELEKLDPRFTYVGGLELKGQDGKFACSWQDDIMQVIFHVATLMPNRESDPAAILKKCHIGNDFVNIVYNDSGVDFDMATLKGQFNYVCIMVEPSDYGTNVVFIKAKKETSDLLGHVTPNLISDECLAIYVRQLALHANLASLVRDKEQQNSPHLYITNWLERLRKLKLIKDKVLLEIAKDEEEIGDSPKTSKDFTSYV